MKDFALKPVQPTTPVFAGTTVMETIVKSVQTVRIIGYYDIIAYTEFLKSIL